MTKKKKIRKWIVYQALQLRWEFSHTQLKIRHGIAWSWRRRKLKCLIRHDRAGIGNKSRNASFLWLLQCREEIIKCLTFPVYDKTFVLSTPLVYHVILVHFLFLPPFNLDVCHFPMFRWGHHHLCSQAHVEYLKWLSNTLKSMMRSWCWNVLGVWIGMP